VRAGLATRVRLTKASSSRWTACAERRERKISAREDSVAIDASAHLGKPVDLDALLGVVARYRPDA
jgi:hypothetical protein